MRRLFRYRRERVERNGVSEVKAPGHAVEAQSRVDRICADPPPVCTVSEQSRSAGPEPLLLGSAEGVPTPA